MKDLRLLAIAAVAAFLMIVVTGCTENTTAPADDPLNGLYAQPSATDQLVLPVEMQDATIETDALLVPNEYADAIEAEAVRGDNRRPSDHMNNPRLPGAFHRLLGALNLTDEQAEKVQELLGKHHECVASALSVLREHVKTILDGVKEARHEVLAKLQAGEITREEARAAIREINARARQALKDSNVIARVREMLKACDQEFIEALKGILTPDQLEILQRWLDHRGNPGDPTGPGTGRRG